MYMSKIVWLIICYFIVVVTVSTQESTITDDVIFDRVLRDSNISDKEFQFAKNLVRKSEEFRGNKFQDFVYDMRVVDYKKKEVDSTTAIKVNVRQNIVTGERSSLVHTESGNNRGNLILLKGTNLWFYKPGTSHALRISPAQRFVGGASFADIAATNYTLYYEPVEITEVKIVKSDAYQIELVKIKKGVAYDYLTLFVAKGSNRPIKGEFYTRSRKLIKTIYFRDFTQIAVAGSSKKQVLSIEWVLVDNLTPDNYTLISIDRFGFETLPESSYTAEGLLRQ